MMKTIIISSINKNSLKRIITKIGKSFIIEFVYNANEILNLFKQKPIAFILFDIESKGIFPTKLFKILNAEYPSTKIFILTRDEKLVLRQGLNSYKIDDIFKIANYQEVSETEAKIITNSIKEKVYSNFANYVQEEIKQNTTLCENTIKYTKNNTALIGVSKAVDDIKEFINRSAKMDAPILLMGETGTGKTTVAKIIHQESKFKKGKFISVNVSCIPEGLAESVLFGSEKGSFTGAENTQGLFEAANEGTLFLDEIEDLSLSLQSKLLDIIESKQIRKVGAITAKTINFRLICASNQDLKELVKKKKIRQDLYFRLDVLRLTIPKLSDRKEDIPYLVKFFLNSKNKQITNEAIEKLFFFEWKGNIRELFNCLERACCNSLTKNTIEESDIEF